MQTITYYRNDTRPIRVTVRDRKTLVPINITGKLFSLTIDPSENPTDDTANVATLTGVVEDGANGVVAFTPTENQMNFAPADYWFDVQMSNANGTNRTTAIKGRFYHKQDITK